MANVLEGDVGEIEIQSIIGFDGTTVKGLRMHPDGIHIIYPIGNKVTIVNWKTKHQNFLTGHTNIISAIDVSKSGKYIASGQINHIGFRAMVIIWKYETRTIITTHEVHKVRVEAIRFTRGDKYLITLGGRDCSSIVVWDLINNRPLCGAPASKGSQGDANSITVCTKREPCFVTAGDGTLIVWKIDSEAFKLRGTDVKLLKLKRIVYAVAIDDKDEYMYCGTGTGDILKVKLNYHHDPEILDPTSPPIMSGCYGRIPRKGEEKVELYPGGVRSIFILDKNVLLIGGGDGTINVVQEVENTLVESTALKLPSTPQLKVLQETNVYSMVTSFLKINKNTMFIATVNCEIYSLNLTTFDINLILSCHTTTIFNIAFPHNFSSVFATAGKNDVRIWNLKTTQELLRIKVQNFSCSGAVFSHDGKSIITAWNDGIIRAFTPLTGRLIYEILNAHNKGVSAVQITDNDKMVISGGCEGQVRCWNITPTSQDLICTLKEHKGPVSGLHINKFNDEAVSSSTDGSCIIWDIVRKCRKQILFSNTLFMCVKYHPSSVQILTGGSNRKIAYWEVYDGNLIREIDGSKSAGLNVLDIEANGDVFVTGGNDQFIKLWKYNEGITTHVGMGHAGVITAIAFSPDGQNIVSCSSAGSIFIWKSPYAKKEAAEEENQAGSETALELKQNKRDSSKNLDVEENVKDFGSVKQEETLKNKKTAFCPCTKKRF